MVDLVGFLMVCEMGVMMIGIVVVGCMGVVFVV